MLVSGKIINWLQMYMTKKSWITLGFHQVLTQPALTNCCWACFLINIVFRPLWAQPLGYSHLDASLGMHSLLTMQLHWSFQATFFGELVFSCMNIQHIFFTLSADPVARMNSLYGLNDKQFTYKNWKYSITNQNLWYQKYFWQFY